jgi:hypothetical protein
MRSQKFTWKDEKVPSDASVRRLKSLLAAVECIEAGMYLHQHPKGF